MILNILGAIIALVGVLCIFHGRDFVRKNFNGKDSENTLTLGMKVLGTIISIVGIFLIILK